MATPNTRAGVGELAAPRAGVRELTVALSDPDELFRPPTFDVANGVPPRDSGIDQIHRELTAGSLRGPVKLVVQVPPHKATPQVEHGIKQAVERYCQTGIDQIESELRALHRDGWQTLVIGAILLAVSLAASEAILSSGAPRGIKDFFGNGLFIVAAWVGMWYPLETFIYSGRPYRLERRVLRAMQAMEIVVVPERFS